MTKTVDKIVLRDSDGRYSIDFIYEDDFILLVHKPAGLLTIPDHWNKDKACLKSVLDTHLKKSDPTACVYVVHRLDKDTSGIMVFAKSAQAHKHLSRQFEARQTKKIYHAVVSGKPYPEEGLVDEPISKKMKKGAQKYIDHKNGQEAQTRYKLLKKYKDFSLLEAQPLSGRMHQIRVHLKHLGHPLAVDPVYALNTDGIQIKDLKKRVRYKTRPADSEYEKTSYIINRLTLHAVSLTFIHPHSLQEMTFSAPFPKDFASLLKQLDKWNAV